MATDQASAPLLPSGAGTGQGGGTFSAYLTLEMMLFVLVEPPVLVTMTVVKLVWLLFVFLILLL